MGNGDQGMGNEKNGNGKLKMIKEGVTSKLDFEGMKGDFA